MLRLMICAPFLFSLTSIVCAADTLTADQVIAKAIKVLEVDRDKVKDTFEQSRIDKAIRELEALCEDGPNSKPETLQFEVTPAALNKKFAGKAVFNAKTGELTLTYDFAAKGQLADFEVGGKKVVVAKKAMVVEAGDNLTHVARFRSFTVNAVVSFNEMNGIGFASSNGMDLDGGGQNHDTLSLQMPLGQTAAHVVSVAARKGSVPVSLTVTPQKATGKWANEVLSVPAPVLAVQREEPPHQVVFKAGGGGCGFSKLSITGVPDPEWLREFLGE